jgi:hypothetical protein
MQDLWRPCIFRLCSGYPLQRLSLRQSGPVLRIIDTKGCAMPHHSGLPSRNLSGEHGHGTGTLCVSNGLSRLGHLHLQRGDICAALG